MSLSINTNILSISAQRNLSKSQKNLQTSLARLSSGLRINSAKDDAAGLAISDRMTAQIRGLNQAIRNANDGISLTQTAEGAINENVNILQRIRELAIHSANDANSMSDRASLQSEVNQLLEELNRISKETSFNKINVLDGSITNAMFQVGANKSEVISTSIPSVNGDNLGNHALTTSSIHGIEAATYMQYFKATGEEGGAYGDEFNFNNPMATNVNGLSGETIIIRNSSFEVVGSASVQQGADLTDSGGLVEQLEGINGVYVKGSNVVTLSGGINTTGSSATIMINGHPLGNLQTLANHDAIASAINSNADLQAEGIFAVSNGTTTSVYNNTGADIAVAIDTIDPGGPGDFARLTATGMNGQSVVLDANSSTPFVYGLKSGLGSDRLIIEGIDIGVVPLWDKQAIADAVNDSMLPLVRGITATVYPGDPTVFLDFPRYDEFDIRIGDGTGTGNASIEVAGYDGPITITSSSVTQNSYTSELQQPLDSVNTRSFAGTLELAIPQGYTMSSDRTNGLFQIDASAEVSTVQIGYTDTFSGNANGEQNLKISGTRGTSEVFIKKDASGFEVASAVNGVSNLTGIIADAKTKATLFDFSEEGTIGFNLQGKNDSPVLINGQIYNNGAPPPSMLLDELARAVNENSGITGITAGLSDDREQIILYQEDGHDINISDFNHSAAINAHDQTNNPTTGTGATILPFGLEQSVKVLGSEGGIANASTLIDGGTRSIYDSTVVGAEVKFYGDGEFQVSSNIDATNSGGSVFESLASVETASFIDFFINEIDIRTSFGCNKAIMAVDGALLRLGTIRGDLGAIQNRFEHTIANLQNISQNLSAARSRIQDADIAAETSAITKQNILQHAGVSILTQANQQPQLALSLVDNISAVS